MDNKIKTITKALIAKTKAGETNWRVSSSEGEFCLYLDHSTITIGIVPTFNVMTYALRLYNDKGDVVALVESNDENDREDNALLEQLYTEADKSFKKEKQTLDSIIKELSQVGVVGKDFDPADLPF